MKLRRIFGNGPNVLIAPPESMCTPRRLEPRLEGNPITLKELLKAMNENDRFDANVYLNKIVPVGSVLIFDGERTISRGSMTITANVGFFVEVESGGVVTNRQIDFSEVSTLD